MVKMIRKNNLVLDILFASPDSFSTLHPSPSCSELFQLSLEHNRLVTIFVIFFNYKTVKSNPTTLFRICVTIRSSPDVK